MLNVTQCANGLILCMNTKSEHLNKWSIYFGVLDCPFSSWGIFTVVLWIFFRSFDDGAYTYVFKKIQKNFFLQIG